jgi:hypothetical protein
MTLPIDPQVEARVRKAIEDHRSVYERLMQWDSVSEKPPKHAVSTTPSCRIYYPDGMAFVWLCQAEALSSFLGHGDIDRAIEHGRREWREYVATHNARIVARGWCGKHDFTNVPCREDQWGEPQDQHIRHLCSTDAEISALREAQHDSRRMQQQVADHLDIQTAPSKAYVSRYCETMSFATAGQLDMHRVSIDYLRRRFDGVSDFDLGHGAVWSVAERRGQAYLLHLASGALWDMGACSIDEVVHFAVEHSTDVIRRLSEQGVDALLEAFSPRDSEGPSPDSGTDDDSPHRQ